MSISYARCIKWLLLLSIINTTNLLANISPHSATFASGKITRDANSNKNADNPSDNKIEPRSTNNKVILLIWDGLRVDAISKEHTPNLYKIKQEGTFFSDHHSSYPTVTMNNANSFATGNYSGQTGFYGNKSWRPDLRDVLKPELRKVFLQPVYTESPVILDALDQAQIDEPILYAETLLQIARKYGLKTAQVGKYGPIALQDANKPGSNGIMVTDVKIYPGNFAQELYEKGYSLPAAVIDSLPKNAKKLSKLDPTQEIVLTTPLLEIASIDGKVPLIGLSNPQNATLDTRENENAFYMDIFLKEILPDHKPDLSVVWLTSPDENAHYYGSGSNVYYQSLKNQDLLLGKLLLNLEKLGISKTTNLIIASDHGHSNVSADLQTFPLRDITNNSIGEISKDGYSVSGMIRVADVLNTAGFKAFDGNGCDYNPILYGMLPDRTFLMPIKVDDADGSVCGDSPKRLYTSQRYYVPEKLPSGAVIVANNGGSAFVYVPDGDETIVKKLVQFFQSRPEFDSIFIDDDKYGDLPGTLSMKSVNFYDGHRQRHPDLLIAMSYDEKQFLQGVPGTTYANGGITRGSHGSLSPIDIKNTFVAKGPDFKNDYYDSLPTANVDVPVTIAYLLNLPFENRAGRPVLEAIKSSGIKSGDYELKYQILQPSKPASNLKIANLTSLNGEDIVSNKDSYTFALYTKRLSFNNKEYTYIDYGKATRY